jgi:4-diphosphocytidyl-2-C-methyl-D-erythritol kinase
MASAATILLFVSGCAWSPPGGTGTTAAHLHASVQRRASVARLVAAASSLDGGPRQLLRSSVVFGDQPPTLSLVAPAKVNLFLRILRKREDAFHELASLFQTVSLFDDLDFWLMPREDDRPLCSMEV